MHPPDAPARRRSAAAALAVAALLAACASTKPAQAPLVGITSVYMEGSGVAAAIAERDGPFGDYSQAPPERKPRR